MTPKEVLQAARKLIERPEAWTKGAFARNSFGEPADWLGDEASCWCASGAMRRAVGHDPNSEEADLLSDARHLLSVASGTGDSVVVINDHSTHAEVLAAFDRAIEAAS